MGFCPLVGIPSQPPLWGGSMGWVGGPPIPLLGKERCWEMEAGGGGSATPGVPNGVRPLVGSQYGAAVGWGCGVGADPTLSRGGAAPENTKRTSIILTPN